MRKFDNNNISKNIKNLCQILLKKKQTVFQNFLFCKNIFKKICRKIENRNKTKIIQDIAWLIVFSAETLAIYKTIYLDYLIENINKNWINSISVKNLKSQSNYSVEFRQFAFIDKQLKKFDSFIISIYKIFFFVAIYRIYFLFLICKIKCGATTLNVANRQNVYSITIVVKVFVDLFKSIKREKKLD